MFNFIREDVKNKRSQDLPTYYRLNGAVFVSEIEYLYKGNGFIGVETKAFVMSQVHSVDIDTELDFIVAKSLIEEK